MPSTYMQSIYLVVLDIMSRKRRTMKHILISFDFSISILEQRPFQGSQIAVILYFESLYLVLKRLTCKAHHKRKFPCYKREK
jgi:hypothetical protein